MFALKPNLHSSKPHWFRSNFNGLFAICNHWNKLKSRGQFIKMNYFRRLLTCFHRICMKLPLPSCSHICKNSLEVQMRKVWTLVKFPDCFPANVNLFHWFLLLTSFGRNISFFEALWLQEYFMSFLVLNEYLVMKACSDCCLTLCCLYQKLNYPEWKLKMMFTLQFVNNESN